MEKVFGKTKGLNDTPFSYCPGCGHGIVHRMVAESLEELDLLHRAVIISPVGCSVFAYKFFDTDNIQAAHGRAPAVATGLKRADEDLIVISYQGDGDLASSGTAEIVHAAARGENFTVVFVNNAIYGMTGGQMAPTTLIGQKTATSPYGRERKFAGDPIKVSEMLATLEAPVYIERTALDTIAHLNKTKKAIKKAIKMQAEGKGFNMVEVLSTCNVNWGMSPTDAMDWLAENMIPVYPLGVYKDKTVDAKEASA
jgi:2-oxoglutarate ferredoxin oxidoreductase subunit beta